ncbi:hypothetical protein [Streptomyces crystallinus]
MRKAGRPQGRLKGDTAEANALARFVRDITAGRSVRALAQRYRLGKTTWSEYRSAEKVIPWHWLELLVQDLPVDPHARSELLALAGDLHRAATEAAVNSARRTPENRTGAGSWLRRHHAPTALVRTGADVSEPPHEVARSPEAAVPEVLPARIVRLDAASDTASFVRGEVLDAADTPHSNGVVVLRMEPPKPVPHSRRRILALPPGGTAPSSVRRRRVKAGPALAVALLLVAVGVLLGVRLGAPATSDWSDEPGTSDSVARPQGGPTPSSQAPPPSVARSPEPVTPPASPPVSPSAAQPPTPEEGRHERGPASASLPQKQEAPASTGDQTVPAAPSGTLYAIAPDHRSVRQWRGDGDAWSRIGGPADRILAGKAGLFAVDADSKRLLGYLGAPGKWAPVSEPAAEFAISGDQLYRIAPDHSAVQRWNGTGTTWTTVGGPASHLYGGGAGLFATHPGDGRIYRYDSATGFWPYVGNAGADFAVTDRHLYGLTPDRSEVFQWNGGASSAWFRVGGSAMSLHASPNQVFAISSDHGRLLRYTDTPESWTPASEAGAEFTMTAHHVFRLSPDRGAVFQGTTQDPGSWTRIGGPAAALVASP